MSAFGGGKKIVDLHLDRGNRALASEVTVQRHADRRIGQGGRDASVSDGSAIGQLVDAERTRWSRRRDGRG